MTENALIEAARVSKAWPFQEAQKLLKRYPDGKPGGEPMLFETGYGPSGLPHIGTFQEVLRTTLVRHAYETLTGGAPTRLVAFSDDMDGLRKVPDNIPNAQLLADNLGKPLSRIPDPFGKFESFAHHNNAMLRDFLDRFGFEYEFVSASDRYNSGAFDSALSNVLSHYDAIMGVMLPTLREERRKTYSPVLPVSPTTGAVLQVPVEVLDPATGMIRFADEDGSTVEQSVFGGHAKLQWKVDWAMRWVDLGVDYEMCGKDLTDSVTQSGKISQILGRRKPEGLIYELFLDENGEKISKSKGNGLTIEQWLTYGTEESLGFYLFREPKSAKQLHIGVIPKAVDEYWQFRGNLPDQTLEKQLGNPVWHLLRATGNGEGAGDTLPVTFSLLLNLVGVLGADATADQVWSYLGNYVADATPEAHPELGELVRAALATNRDFIAPTLVRRAPAAHEAEALNALDAELAKAGPDTSAEELQNTVYEIGKNEAYGFGNLRDWFKALYETLLGSSQGPRMGSFIALYGIPETRKLIAEALSSQ
ncbi:lysine--tRNA ligase [Novosphingobium pentaromativorans]|uniref:Lysine--tRNA ligase n=1 Tax=Novosphingobium pentaromativorans US6-1 TaxID=1088721 RepID=G6EIJ4_9SPHN|nr:lysine--tRNA ligase [Novosphingobium pentaromativorans]AIT78816.1 lysine--tRNA ligase [Novosphingobium pentaromativorans US6-1]EHJ58936.1 lysyl-tRNA synthetase, class I [Novosphingobium pentaromativorans US6-1]